MFKRVRTRDQRLASPAASRARPSKSSARESAPTRGATGKHARACTLGSRGVLQFVRDRQHTFQQRDHSSVLRRGRLIAAPRSPSRCHEHPSSSRGADDIAHGAFTLLESGGIGTGSENSLRGLGRFSRFGRQRGSVVRRRLRGMGVPRPSDAFRAPSLSPAHNAGFRPWLSQSAPSFPLLVVGRLSPCWLGLRPCGPRPT